MAPRNSILEIGTMVQCMEQLLYKGLSPIFLFRSGNASPNLKRFVNIFSYIHDISSVFSHIFYLFLCIYRYYSFFSCFGTGFTKKILQTFSILSPVLISPILTQDRPEAAPYLPCSGYLPFFPPRTTISARLWKRKRMLLINNNIRGLAG